MTHLLDTSALLAHYLAEPGAERVQALFEDDAVVAGASILSLYEFELRLHQLGVDEAKFAECLSSGRHAPRVERGLADGAAAGVQGTPGFVVGKTQTGDMVEGTPIRGAQPLETFRRIIDLILAEPVDQSAFKP